jgi:hypothetical protein
VRGGGGAEEIPGKASPFLFPTSNHSWLNSWGFKRCLHFVFPRPDHWVVKKRRRDLEAKRKPARRYVGASGSTSNEDKPSREYKAVVFQALYKWFRDPLSHI